MGIYKDIIAGSVGGIASTLVCHPFDTIRTRMQTDGLVCGKGNLSSSNSPKYINGVDCFKKTVKGEGFRALYRGMSGPLAAQAVYKAVMFGAFGFSSRELLSRNIFVEKTKNNESVKRLSLTGIFSCGAFAGLTNSFVVCPVELVRNRLIIQKSNLENMAGVQGRRHYLGVRDCITRVIKHEPGGVFALWRGLPATMLRDGPGVGAWFAAFELSKRFLSDHGFSGAGLILLSGASGGICFWIVALPFDAIKSVIQTTNPNSTKGNGSGFSVMYKVAQNIIGRSEANGINSRPLTSFLALYKGFGISVARGIPGAAIVFLAQGKAHEILDGIME